MVPNIILLFEVDVYRQTAAKKYKENDKQLQNFENESERTAHESAY